MFISDQILYLAMQTKSEDIFYLKPDDENWQ